MPPPSSPPGYGGVASSGVGQHDWTCSHCGKDNWSSRTECRFCAWRRPPSMRARSVSRTATRNKQAFGSLPSGKGTGRSGRAAPSGVGGPGAESEELALQLAHLKRL
eukprot:12900301-Prorocentrum_lima.AAC.1